VTDTSNTLCTASHRCNHFSRDSGLSLPQPERPLLQQRKVPVDPLQPASATDSEGEIISDPDARQTQRKFRSCALCELRARHRQLREAINESAEKTSLCDCVVVKTASPRLSRLRGEETRDSRVQQGPKNDTHIYYSSRPTTREATV